MAQVKKKQKEEFDKDQKIAEEAFKTVAEMIKKESQENSKKQKALFLSVISS